MKHSRRMFAFLLALCLMLSGMAAAGGARADDVVSLSYYYSVASSPDVMMVQGAINEITRETIGAEVKLYPIHPSDYVQKMQVMLSAGEELDLCFTADWKLPYTSNATKGCFADITDLLPELAPVTWSQYSGDLWNAVRINGRIYASINRQVFARQSGFALRQDMVEKYNFDAKAVTKLSDLGDFMALVKEGEDPTATQRLFSYTFANWKAFQYMYYNYGWENIGDATAPGSVRSLDGEHRVFNEYDTDEFRDFIATCADFAAKGYIPANELTQPTVDDTVSVCGVLSTYSPSCVDGTVNGYFDAPAIYVPVGKPIITTSNATATMTAVGATSRHVDTAVQFIEQLNANADVYHLISYGIRGTHYDLDEKGMYYKLQETVTYSAPSYMFGDTWNAFIAQGGDPEQIEKSKLLNETADVSRLMGFIFDAANVTTEIANCSAVTNEYMPTFATGGFGDKTQQSYEEFLKKLEAAGVQRVLEEKQRQVDQFLVN